MRELQEQKLKYRFNGYAMIVRGESLAKLCVRHEKILEVFAPLVVTLELWPAHANAAIRISQRVSNHLIRCVWLGWIDEEKGVDAGARPLPEVQARKLQARLCPTSKS